MKYKINHWRCLWLLYKDTKLSFFDWLDNEWVGIILTYFLYYVFSIVCLPLFIVLAFIWYIKRVVKIKKNMSNSIVIDKLKSMKVVKEVEKVGDK